jgi:hypothetical protein
MKTGKMEKIRMGEFSEMSMGRWSDRAKERLSEIFGMECNSEIEN